MSLHFKVDTKIPGTSHLKFNNSLLNDKEYVEALIGKYNDWIEEFSNKNDKGGLWDWLKFKIRAFSIPFSQKIKSKREEKSKYLEKEFKRIDEIEEKDEYLMRKRGT